MFSKDKFKANLKSLIEEIYDVKYTLAIQKELMNTIEENKEYYGVYKMSPMFFEFIKGCSMQVLILNIAKIYEGPTAFGIQKIIDTIRSNKDSFTVSEEIEYISLRGRSSIKYDEVIKIINKKYGSVRDKKKVILELRNKAVAHNDEEYFSRIEVLFSENKSGFNEIEQLADAALDICVSVLYILYGVNTPREINLDGIRDMRKLFKNALIGEDKSLS